MLAKKMINKFLRLCSIFLVIVGTLWFGIGFGPNHAQAEVYKNVNSQVQSFVDYLRLESRAGGKRRMVINGVSMNCEISATNRTPKQLMDELEQKANEQFATLQASVEKTLNNKITLAFHRPYRTEGNGWGAFVRLMGDDFVSDDSILKQVVDGNGLGSGSAGGGLVLAILNSDQISSTVWKFKFNENLDPFKLIAEQGKDVPGGDIEYIDRFPGSSRSTRFSEFADGYANHVVVYQSTDGEITDHVDHFTKLMGNNGFALANQPEIKNEQSILFFDGNNKQITVFISRAQIGLDQITDVVQVRHLLGSNS